MNNDLKQFLEGARKFQDEMEEAGFGDPDKLKIQELEAENIRLLAQLAEMGAALAMLLDRYDGAACRRAAKALAPAPEVLWAKAGKLWHEPYQVGDDTYIWAEYLEEVGSVRISGVKPGKHGQRVRVTVTSAEEER